MKIIRQQNMEELDTTRYEQIFQLDYLPNENQWSIDSCTLVIPERYVQMGKNPLTSTGGKFMEDQVNNELILIDQKYINSHWFEGKYQDYYISRTKYDKIDVICINLTSKILGKYYYLGISNKTFPIVVNEILEMFKGSLTFSKEWIKYSYLLDVEFKRDTFIPYENYKECLLNIAEACEGHVKKFYKGSNDLYGEEGEMLLTGIANTHHSETSKRSSKSRKSAFWHVYIKNYQMPYKYKLEKNKNMESAIRNYNGHYKMMKLCGRPKDLVLRLEVNMGNSKLMKSLGIDKSLMNILSLTSDQIQQRIIIPLLRGKFSKFKVNHEPTERLTIDHMILYAQYREKASDYSIDKANEWMESFRFRIPQKSNRTVKSFNDRIKVYEKRYRYEEENLILNNHDMFTVFGKSLATQMLLSKVPTSSEIETLQKRL